MQRNKPVAIWGKATAGENVTVTFGKQTKQTVADANGKWMVHLNAMPASATPASMTIASSNTITLNNILVGEVWLCSGQSNMEFSMAKSSKFANAVRSQGMDSAATANERNKNIRLFLVRRDLTKPDGANVNKGWNETEITYLKDFSAPGYYFARKLYEELNVPIGMIASSVSGSAIDPWLDGTIVKDTIKHTYAMNEKQPGKFFNGMIEPLAPYTLQGFLWYQGETNCFSKETTEYTYKFKHLINSWRKHWNNSNASFYFVQIAPHSYSKGKGLNEQTLPEFREAQSKALDLPNTGMIITTDLVDKIDDIHPTYKWEIGRRLALLALAKTYGKNIAYAGPTYKRMSIKGNKIELAFDHAEGLQSGDGQPLTWFTIAGADGKFVPADAVIKGNKIIVSSSTLTAPVHVRFAWHEAAQPNLYNKAGLPAVPFRTDRPNQSTAKK
ncbi:sialate O-acetylesterase [Aridibaculum aurantiacum]|uniref:sialate O-acetylesterase n=1 Tax=Aridibaculum aurantiacum TaxID=2810307 RepID=UPI001A959764|nr:sialate O-acetylesterase [Aridibaculum aurantiacum]